MRVSSVVRGAVLMVIEDLWMQVRVKNPKTEVTVSGVLGEIQRGPFLPTNPDPAISIIILPVHV